MVFFSKETKTKKFLRSWKIRLEQHLGAKNKQVLESGFALGIAQLGSFGDADVVIESVKDLVKERDILASNGHISPLLLLLINPSLIEILRDLKSEDLFLGLVGLALRKGKKRVLTGSGDTSCDYKCIPCRECMVKLIKYIYKLIKKLKPIYPKLTSIAYLTSMRIMQSKS